MFLSNRLPIVIIFLALALQPACSWFGFGDTPRPPVAVPTPQTDTPFPVREPEEFSSDFFTIAGGTETRRGYARKGGSWKYVIYDANGPTSETIQTDRQVLVDHKRRVFAETTELTGFDPDFIQAMTIRALREREYTNFEDLGLDGNIRKYRATIRANNAPSAVIYYDEILKMITRQEFYSGAGDADLVFEMRNISFEVSDDAFRVPHAYKKVSENEFYNSRK
jgi:hypothetical protein